MTENTIKKINLKNGLDLEFIDISRKIAGDRYRVALLTRIEVPVEKGWFSETNQEIPDIGDIRKKIGNRIIFEQKRERNFIDDQEKEAVIKNIIEVAEDYGIRYLGHPDFPQKLILKRYNDEKQTQAGESLKWKNR